MKNLDGEDDVVEQLNSLSTMTTNCKRRQPFFFGIIILFTHKENIIDF
jgi:hypothetical protein